MRIHTIIFNWRGQYEKTKQKLEQLRGLTNKLTVINSDEEHNDEGWVNIGESAYFNAQFLKAIEVFDGDVLFHVQADASYDKWQKLINDAKKYYKKYFWGIYAPNIDYTWYDASRSDVKVLEVEEDPNLHFVGSPDCTCWFIHKDVINAFKTSGVDMTSYTVGWGWDLILPGLSYLMRRPVFRDYDHTVHHPATTNYSNDKGEEEMQALYNSLSGDLRAVTYWVKFAPANLATLFEEVNG